jgi:hypothetical protein
MGSCFHLLRRRGKLWLASSSESLGSLTSVFLGVLGTDTAVMSRMLWLEVFGVSLWVCHDTLFVLLVEYGF